MVESADVQSAIPPAISLAPKQKDQFKSKEHEPQTEQLEDGGTKKSREKDETDLTRIREKHAKEQAAQRCASAPRSLPVYLISLA